MTIWDGPAPDAGWTRDPEGWWREVDVHGHLDSNRYTRPTPGRYVERCTHALYSPGEQCSWCGGQVPSRTLEVGGVDGAGPPVGVDVQLYRPPAPGTLFG